MKSSWQVETGQIACRWSDWARQAEYTSAWLQDTPQMSGGYLPPPPDFASHSPFGGPDWFELHFAVKRRA